MRTTRRAPSAPPCGCAPACRRVNAELEPLHGVTLEIRIGVNTGEVLATLDPSPGEPMFTGDAVNTAARFEQHARPGQILASERTVRAARGFATTDAGVLEMKGKAAPVKAFAVLHEDVSTPPRGVPGLSAAMVGRDAELELLASMVARVAIERRPHLVTIYGEPGVGKSRLTQEFLASATEGRVVRGRCLPYGDGVTYWPLAEILKGVAGVLDSDPPQVALDRVSTLGRTLLGEDAAARRAAAALAFTMGLDDPAIGFAETDPKQANEEIGQAWRAFFGALAREAPVLALVEDIHWADPALLDLLERLAEEIEGPVLFLCPARPELLGARPTWGGGKRNYSALSLDPLTAEESEDLMRALLDIDDLPTSVHAQILERAGGNPFFLEEIVRQLVDGGHVVRQGERWRATGEVEDGRDPGHRPSCAGGAYRSAGAGTPGRAAGGCGRGARLLARGGAPPRARRSARRVIRTAAVARPDPGATRVHPRRRNRVHLQARAHARCRVRDPPARRTSRRACGCRGVDRGVGGRSLG